MDWIYDIIESASKLVDKDKGILVLHRSMIPGAIKAYKKFGYNLYLTKAKNKTLLLSEEYIVNCKLDDIEKQWIKQDKVFLDEFIKYITSDKFKELTNGI